ncbi:site-specific DNA-methyltransferase [Pseudomonas tolaasii]|uniref:site-specific DNA-methyltransferase (adenine-specific) n=1 Tax=Pseudomonas tolaasii NCPPB 2192 TaxID=564423 RepID=A0ABX4QAC5_PSETO|nr:site-specific DNA-methyltransferase [Pseudomonas tolaasii]ARB28990.1 site-specific DNA-methyltransferase [Pseudomonas tolaasii]KAB0474804.1 site-specific DNA-methyltransferase [Pseudomonas tolaasii]PKA73764.1 adenine-specific DNA-methyltransferase [Pseudomonas tolaasii NCPPB 2192]
MDKLKMHSSNLTEANIAKLAELFPNCITEARDAKGKLKQTVDFDLLRQELSSSIVEGPQERYQLNWPGKREALLTANAPIAKTLRPCREDSVNFDTTQNLFIEGDNLEALKLLQEVYLNKVSLIYIDPPYNTGGDFIYEDDFAEDVDTYLYRSNQRSEIGDRMIANPESNGRIHSDWLSMIYSRLRLARSLLRDDGLIFISIDDNEQANLQKVCDEIFGESNFRGKVSRATGTPSGQGHGILVNEVDFILIYSKSEEATLYGLPFTADDQKIYDQQDKFGRYLTRTLRKTGGEDRREDRPTMYYGVEAPDGEKVFPIGPGGYESRWRCGPKSYEELKSNNLIEWKQVVESGVQVWKPYQKFYLEGRLKQPSNLWQNIEGNKKASIDIKGLFGAKVFDTPKPLELIKRCISIGMQSDGIVVDFFAGSATTAHAVMALNAEDQGTRRYVMIQLPEACPEDSEAYKNGYSKISDIGKERIRRAGTKIKAANAMTVPDLDTGFRTLKVDTSNMKEVYYNPDAVSQDLLSDQVDNIREDRTAEDLLFQVLLDWGVDLALPISQQSIFGKTVFFVDGNTLVACFDTGIDEDFVKQLAGHQPLRVVFRDSGFASDSVKINVEQVFKLLSPATEIKTL